MDSSGERLLTLNQVYKVYDDIHGEPSNSQKELISNIYKSYPELFTTASVDKNSNNTYKRIADRLDDYISEYETNTNTDGISALTFRIQSDCRALANHLGTTSEERNAAFKEEYESNVAYYENSLNWKDGSDVDLIDSETENTIKNDAIKEHQEAKEKQPAQTPAGVNKPITEPKNDIAEFNDTNASMRSKIEEIRNNIITMKLGNSDNLDIVNELAWMDTDLSAEVNSGMSGFGLKGSVPVVYAIEYEQTVSSVISNIVNNINIAANGITNTLDAANSVIKSIVGDTSDSNIASSSSVPEQSSDNTENTSLFSKIANFAKDKLAMEGITSDMVLLSPYQYLYATKKTGKRFVFPFFDDNTFPSITNTWDASKAEEGSMLLNNTVTDMIKFAASSIANIETDVSNFANMYTGKGSSAAATIMEMAKSFNYKVDGDSLSVKFALFNTVIKNNSRSMWKKHYKFLYLFMARNMPWKITPSSFLPPLLYDVIMPGQKRFPLAYVSNIKVQSKGIIRKLSMNNFIDSSDSVIQVNVPEVWVVEITFKSLIGDNANLLISGIHDLKIATSEK